MTKLAQGGAVSSSGREITYIEKATNTSVTNQTAPNAITVIQTGNYVFNGTTKIQFIAYSSVVLVPNAGIPMIHHIWVDTTDLGAYWWQATNQTSTAMEWGMFFISPKYTPSAGSHFFTWKARMAGASTGTIFGDPTSGDNLRPCYFRIIVA